MEPLRAVRVALFSCFLLVLLWATPVPAQWYLPSDQILGPSQPLMNQVWPGYVVTGRFNNDALDDVAVVTIRSGGGGHITTWLGQPQKPYLRQTRVSRLMQYGHSNRPLDAPIFADGKLWIVWPQAVFSQPLLYSYTFDSVTQQWRETFNPVLTAMSPNRHLIHSMRIVATGQRGREILAVWIDSPPSATPGTISAQFVGSNPSNLRRDIRAAGTPRPPGMHIENVFVYDRNLGSTPKEEYLVTYTANSLSRTGFGGLALTQNLTPYPGSEFWHHARVSMHRTLAPHSGSVWGKFVGPTLSGLGALSVLFGSTSAPPYTGFAFDNLNQLATPPYFGTLGQPLDFDPYAFYLDTTTADYIGDSALTTHETVLATARKAGHDPAIFVGSPFLNGQSNLPPNLAHHKRVFAASLARALRIESGAHGDFNGDGTQDLVLSISGKYRTSELVVFPNLRMPTRSPVHNQLQHCRRNCVF